MKPDKSYLLPCPQGRGKGESALSGTAVRLLAAQVLPVGDLGGLTPCDMCVVVDRTLLKGQHQNATPYMAWWMGTTPYPQGDALYW
ncbi:MAG: hypothetical protein LBD27_07560 [Tannerella sp.]|nr:hypothetical protein [Tannerella sp.]